MKLLLNVSIYNNLPGKESYHVWLVQKKKWLNLITGLSQMISELGKVLLIFSEGHSVWSSEKSLQMGKRVVGFVLHTPGDTKFKGKILVS